MALEVPRRFELVQGHGLRRKQGIDEPSVAESVKRQIQVIPLALLVARSTKWHLVIDGVGVDDRGDRIVEVERRLSHQPLELGGQLRSREWTGGDDNVITLGNPHHQLVPDIDLRMRPDRLGDLLREGNAIHGQGPPRRHRGLVGSVQDQRAEKPHLLLQEADGTGDDVGAQGIAAHQLGELGDPVGRRIVSGLHLVEDHPGPALRRLPGRLAAGQARAHHSHAGGGVGLHFSPAPW
jgi:hypothetical protein